MYKFVSINLTVYNAVRIYTHSTYIDSFRLQYLLLFYFGLGNIFNPAFRVMSEVAMQVLTSRDLLRPEMRATQ